MNKTQRINNISKSYIKQLQTNKKNANKNARKLNKQHYSEEDIEARILIVLLLVVMVLAIATFCTYGKNKIVTGCLIATILTFFLTLGVTSQN